MSTRKNVTKQFIHYLVPSIVSLVSLSLYILADTFFIANGVGSIGLAALNIALPAYSIVNSVALMFGAGGGVLMAIAQGREDKEGAQKAFQCAVVIAAVTGVVFSILGVVFAERLAWLLGASELSVEYAATYIRTMLAFSISFLLNTTLGTLVRNDGNPRLAMVSMIVNSSANIVLDYLLVIAWDTGMWGAAFATGLSASSGVLILMLHWIMGKNSVSLKLQLPDFSVLGGIVRGGISNCITELGNGLVIILFNYTLMSLAGDVAVAAYGIVANISLVISCLFVGMGQGMQPVVGRQYGMGNMKNCRHVLHVALVLAAVTGILVYVAGLCFPHAMAAVFNSEGDPVLAGYTVRAITVYFSCFLFMGFNICCAAYFQSMLRAVGAMTISLLRVCILVAVFIAILPRFLGLDGVWAVAPAAELCTAAVSAALLGNLAQKTSANEQNAAHN